MKNIIKKFILFVFIFLLISSFSKCFGKQFDISTKENDKEDKSRDLQVQVIDNVALTFNDKLFFSGENDSITDKQKNINNYITLGISAILVIYWIVLLIVFEKEEPCNYTYENIDDITTLKKYNPMIAGCLADNRQALPRDVIAIILNLIQKGYINMEMIPNLKNGEENYIYMISENKEKVDGLDRAEAYVLYWIFDFYSEEEVDLVKRLKELSKSKDFAKNLKKLNDIAEDELNKMGANIPKVPVKLRIFNIILSIFTVIMSTIHIINNGISIHIYDSTIILILLVLIGIIVALPLIALIIHVILILIVLLKKLVKVTADRHSGKKITETSAVILFFMVLMIGLVYLVVPNKYICLDIFMVGMSILIVKTDHLMTKHNPEVLNDYFALNEIKYRIKEYTLIKDEQINYMKLWDEYLIYSVAFGIPIPIINKLKGANKEDDDLDYLLQCETLYYVCKAYLEVMWDMKFKKGISIISLDGLFGIDKSEEEEKEKEEDYRLF